ncbi:MAG: hypothetical protein PHS30_09000, partial [Bacteroidales bacterium]|nr:hypothetical protein [Bacteroidales bacterium]
MNKFFLSIVLLFFFLYPVESICSQESKTVGATDRVSQKNAPAGHDPMTAVFVHTSPVRVTGPEKTVLAKMPPVAYPGEHPRLLLTKQEVAELRLVLDTHPKGREALKVLLGQANEALTGTPDFPDPKGQGAQLKRIGDVLAHQHEVITMNAGILGMAYTLTGNTKYALRAAAILRGYSELYQQYPEHKGVNNNDTGKIMSQRLSEAMWLIPLIISYDYIRNSGVLTEADSKQIENGLLRPAIGFIRRKIPANEVAERTSKNPEWRTVMPPLGTGKPVGNWLLYYNTATLMSGIMIGDQDMVDLGTADFRSLLRQGIGS